MKTHFTRNRLRNIALIMLMCAAATVARAGTVSGTIHNGTNSGKPAVGVDVLLIQLQGTMSIVAGTKTDAQGHYQIDSPAIGAGPMLVRAVYRGVNFHEPLTPGTTNVDVTVYEPTTDPKAIQVPLRLIVFEPNADKLMVGEEFSIQNNSNPPSAYYKQDGNFEFTVPEGATVGAVSTFGPSGMPVNQGTIDKGKGRYAIAYAFQPGQNGVRVSYQIPYKDNRVSFKEPSPYNSDRVMLVIPPTMQVTSPGFAAAGTEQGFNVFAKNDVKAGPGFDVTISGTAPTPTEAPSAEADQVNGRDAGPEPTILTATARLDSEKWILLGGLAAIFAVGVGLLLRTPVPLAAGAPTPAAGAKGFKGQRAAQAKASRPAAPSAAGAPNKEADSNLDSLKDTFLRIELRRQAGKMSEEEYAQERGRAEQMLRELVQG